MINVIYCAKTPNIVTKICSVFCKMCYNRRKLKNFVVGGIYGKKEKEDKREI